MSRCGKNLIVDDFGAPVLPSESSDTTASTENSVNVQIARDFELVHQWFISTTELIERWHRMYKNVDCSQHLHDQVRYGRNVMDVQRIVVLE